MFRAQTLYCGRSRLISDPGDPWPRDSIPGSQRIHAADLPGRIGEVPNDRPVAVIRASGYRASAAASLLAATHAHP
jgi:rhodanese-related sulfurtransferase